MNKKEYLKSNSVRLIGALMLTSCAISPVFSQGYITPPMVDVPTGSFMMGAEHGPDYAKPMHRVEVKAFRMAKYSVTVAEFRRFVEDTGYNPAPACKDYIGKNWLSSPGGKGSASWDNHRFLYSDYQPVTCITWQEANAYAAWLSDKTGNDYRLPTEQEWDYAQKANTTSRYFWGDDLDLTQACDYGNFADHTGEYIPSKEYGASYVGFLEHANCDDGEPYISIVGLYRANPFGLYDMVGNIHHFNGSCYYDGYAERTEQEMDPTQCETIAQSGNNWHSLPTPAAERGSYPRLGAAPLSTMGFRLAMDGHGNTHDASTDMFEKRLNDAQKHRLTTRPRLPEPPNNLQLIKKSENNFILSWQPSDDPRVTGYQIYRAKGPYAHLLGGFYQDHYEKFKTVKAKDNHIKVTLPKSVDSFRVVAETAKLTSLPSEPAFIAYSHQVEIPGRIAMNETTGLKFTRLQKSRRKNNPSPYYISKNDDGFEQPLVTADFAINVKEPGWYYLNYRGSSGQEGKFFTVWNKSKRLVNVSYNKDIDDKTSKRHRVYLEQGQQMLQLSFKREGWDNWYLNWLELNEINAK